MNKSIIVVVAVLLSACSVPIQVIEPDEPHDKVVYAEPDDETTTHTKVAKRRVWRSMTPGPNFGKPIEKEMDPLLKEALERVNQAEVIQ